MHESPNPKRHKAEVRTESDDTAALEASTVNGEIAPSVEPLKEEKELKDAPSEVEPLQEEKELKDAPSEFISFHDASVGVTSTAPFFMREKPWVLQGDADGWWGHESAPWLYNETTNLYFHPPSKQLFERPDPENALVRPATFDNSSEKERLLGAVQWWRREKGYGFIVAEGSTDRIFCHQKQIEDDALRFKGFRVGDQVTFELAVINDKICASAVRPVETVVEDDEEESKSDSDSGSEVEMDLFQELHCSYCTSQGAKEENQDRFIEKTKLPILEGDADMIFLALMDGHNGSSCSDYLQLNWSRNFCTAMGSCKKNLKKSSEKIPFALRKSLELIDHNFLRLVRRKSETDPSGSTVLGLVFYGPDEEGALRLYTAHLGDSRAILCRNGKPLRLTQDHKPEREDEAKRIKQAGGSVVTDAQNIPRVVARVAGTRFALQGLSVSRAVGDIAFKEPNVLVSSEADVNQLDIDMEADDFVILGTDGLYDKLSDEQICSFVLEGGSAEGLVKLARENNSLDDCTAIVVRFGWRKSDDNGTPGSQDDSMLETDGHG